jgi:hypothetical protein
LEPGQDLKGEALDLLFPSHSNGNTGEGGEIGDEIEDTNPLGMDESAARAMDIDVGLGEVDPDEV